MNNINEEEMKKYEQDKFDSKWNDENELPDEIPEEDKDKTEL